jgi:GPH family glycoside/pentoside/hexuronide:cation symporter
MTINKAAEKLELTTKIAFGAGDIGPALTANLLIFFLLPFFTNVASLAPSLAGSILLIGKVSDAINDPIIGILSDRTRTKWGRRLPWILLGAIPFGLVFFLQWIVPTFSSDHQLNQTFLLIYYLIIAVIFNLCYTAVNLPYQALTPELSQDYNERTSLNSFRFSFSIAASILSLILAGVIFQVYEGEDRQKYLILGLISSLIAIIPLLWCCVTLQERGYQPFLTTPQKKFVGFLSVAIATILAVFAVANYLKSASSKDNFIAVICLFFAIFLAVIAWTLITGKTEPHLQHKFSHLSADEHQLKLTFSQQLKIVFSNRPFLYVIGIYLCSWLAVQLTASILLFFVVNWMGLPESQFPQVAISVQGTALIMLFIWQLISTRLDKKTVYFLGTAIWIIAQLGLFMVQPGQTMLLYTMAILAGCGVSVAYLIPWSMVPDVIDLDELETGQRREGIFYGFMVLLQKFGLALGLFLVGIALDAAGFIKNTPGQPLPTQPDSALWAIRLVVAPLPALVLIIGIILAYFYPITRQYHQEIQLKLMAKKD